MSNNNIVTQTEHGARVTRDDEHGFPCTVYTVGQCILRLKVTHIHRCADALETETNG